MFKLVAGPRQAALGAEYAEQKSVAGVNVNEMTGQSMFVVDKSWLKPFNEPVDEQAVVGKGDGPVEDKLEKYHPSYVDILQEHLGIYTLFCVFISHF